MKSLCFSTPTLLKVHESGIGFGCAAEVEAPVTFPGGLSDSDPEKKVIRAQRQEFRIRGSELVVGGVFKLQKNEAS